jgi:hypothetical protein
MNELLILLIGGFLGFICGFILASLILINKEEKK